MSWKTKCLDATDVEGNYAKLLQATLPCGSICYRTIPISVLNTTILEPGISSIDARYLASPSTTCHSSHIHTWC